jgi:uncharacterized protein (DUF58 family)
VAAVFAFFPQPRVRLEYQLPMRATALTPLRFSVRVINDSTRLLPDLQLSFPRPRKWGSSIAFRPREAFLSAEPGQESAISVEFQATRRGGYRLRRPVARAMDPLRLTTTRAETLPEETLLVYPRFYRMGEFRVPLGRRYQPGGIPLSSSTGDSIEFVGTREYRAGDPIKNIHWRSWARRGQPVVKEFQEEYFCRIAVILDTFLPRRVAEEDTRRFEAAISVIASIADYFSRSEYIVDILAAGPDIYEVSAGRSLAYLENILDVLACLEPCYDPPFQTIEPFLFDQLAQTTTVVAVLLDWDTRREDFLHRIRSLGTAVRILVVCEEPTQQSWQSFGEETGEVTLVTPSEVERRLAEEVARNAERQFVSS